MITHLYARNRQIFIVDKYLCDICRIVLSGVAFHYYNSRGYVGEIELVLCGRCLRDLSPEYKIGEPELRAGVVVDVPPIGAFPILSPTEKKVSRTIPEAMMTVARDAKTIDRTKRAGRPGYVIDDTAKIGKSPEIIDQESRQRLQDVAKEPLKFLVASRDAIPLIDDQDDDIKRLEVVR